jgi:hypothetical protein
MASATTSGPTSNGSLWMVSPGAVARSTTRRRYYAACVAARAGCGQGQDAADVDEKGRAGFRQQARDWLGAELEARRRPWKEEPAQALHLVQDLENWLM